MNIIRYNKINEVFISPFVTIISTRGMAQLQTSTASKR